MQPSGAICYNQRLAVQQLSTSPNLEFKFRSFRFSKIDDSADDKDTQHQTVSCKIHLDPSASVPQTPTDCSCFSPSKGFNDRFWLFDSTVWSDMWIPTQSECEPEPEPKALLILSSSTYGKDMTAGRIGTNGGYASGMVDFEGDFHNIISQISRLKIKVI